MHDTVCHNMLPFPALNAISDKGAVHILYFSLCPIPILFSAVFSAKGFISS